MLLEKEKYGRAEECLLNFARASKEAGKKAELYLLASVVAGKKAEKANELQACAWLEKSINNAVLAGKYFELAGKYRKAEECFAKIPNLLDEIGKKTEAAIKFCGKAELGACGRAHEAIKLRIATLCEKLGKSGHLDYPARLIGITERLVLKAKTEQDFEFALKIARFLQELSETREYKSNRKKHGWANGVDYNLSWVELQYDEWKNGKKASE